VLFDNRITQYTNYCYLVFTTILLNFDSITVNYWQIITVLSIITINEYLQYLFLRVCWAYLFYRYNNHVAICNMSIVFLVLYTIRYTWVHDITTVERCYYFYFSCIIIIFEYTILHIYIYICISANKHDERLQYT
jgi:hypothetical protein